EELTNLSRSPTSTGQLKTGEEMRSTFSIATSVTLSLGLVANPFIAAAALVTPVPTTPIQHVVVIYGENVSFDHFFATYPNAANPPGQPKFIALPGTPSVNGLSGTLLTANPNSLNSLNG